VFTAADTDSDVVKVSDIGITTSNTSTADANLKFNVSVVDADGDITATQTLNVTIEGSHTFVGLDGVVESITGTSSGNDILTGGTGSDIFHWNTGDTGQDTITDFSKGPVGSGGDVLNLTDLLQGEHQTVASLADGGYLSFSYSGGNTTITIDANGTTGVGGSGQTIVLQGVDLTAGNTLSAQDIVTNLLNDHQLKTDA
jgi:Ca2+-binding RTX toxin-like protein